MTKMKEKIDNEINDGEKGAFNQDIYTKVVKAGNRTYFFDVKLTRKEEHYITITESKKKLLNDGQFQFEKHKIFLYSEDFDKFTDALYDCFNFVNKGNSDSDTENDFDFSDTDTDFSDESPDTDKMSDYTNVEFDDLTN